MTLLRLDEYFQNIVILNNAVIEDGRVESESKKDIMLLCEVVQNAELSTEFTKFTKKTYSYRRYLNPRVEQDASHSSPSVYERQECSTGAETNTDPPLSLEPNKSCTSRSGR